ncbi:acyl-CoA synthetase family member 2, mitochondrial [Trichonephila clavipes]|nr:acyl-CoA synthetase family member 2, mitochondrial [Trichonephila clavipes]
MTYLPIVHISIPFPVKRKTFPSLIRINDWNKLSTLSTDSMGCQMTVNKRLTYPVADRCSRGVVCLFEIRRRGREPDNTNAGWRLQWQSIHGRSSPQKAWKSVENCWIGPPRALRQQQSWPCSNFHRVTAVKQTPFLKNLVTGDESWLLFKNVKRKKNYHTHLEEEYANYRKPPDGADSTSQRRECKRGKHLDDFLRGRIIGRLECGRTQLEVSEELGIAQSVISRLWQRFQDDSNVSRCYSTGHPRVTTPNEDRYLAVTAKRSRWITASDLSRQLSSATGTTISRQIVYRRLRHIGLYASRPVRCVPLTATHCCLRLTWSREHALWTPQQWSCVMFSDESRFSLQSHSHRTLIWRTPGTRYHQENTIERHRYGGAGWLVWGGIILGSRTDLHVQIVTMTGHIYRDVILEQHVRLFRGRHVC